MLLRRVLSTVIVLVAVSACSSSSPSYPELDMFDESLVPGEWCSDDDVVALSLREGGAFTASNLHAGYTDHEASEDFWGEDARDGGGEWSLYSLPDHLVVQLNFPDGSWTDFYTGRDDGGPVLWNKIDSNGKYSTLTACDARIE